MAKAKKVTDDTPSWLDQRLKDHYEEHGKYVGPKMEQVLLKVREDGTKVYMMHTVDKAHRLYPDGTKVYESENTQWVMPNSSPRKPKRRDIHTTIDKQIFKAVDSLKHAKKRVVIKEVRNMLMEMDDITEYLPKNVGITISRRIGILVDKRNLEYEKQTKTRTVLVRGKYKYVGG